MWLQALDCVLVWFILQTFLDIVTRGHLFLRCLNRVDNRSWTEWESSGLWPHWYEHRERRASAAQRDAGLAESFFNGTSAQGSGCDTVHSWERCGDCTPVAISKRLDETHAEVHLMSLKYGANNIMTQNDGNWQDETHLIFPNQEARSPRTSSHCDLYIITQPFRP